VRIRAPDVLFTSTDGAIDRNDVREKSGQEVYSLLFPGRGEYVRKGIRSTIPLPSSWLLIVVSGLLIEIGQDCEEVTAGIRGDAAGADDSDRPSRRRLDVKNVDSHSRPDVLPFERRPCTDKGALSPPENIGAI
jgi:hypothetical protein